MVETIVQHNMQVQHVCKHVPLQVQLLSTAHATTRVSIPAGMFQSSCLVCCGGEWILARGPACAAEFCAVRPHWTGICLRTQTELFSNVRICTGSRRPLDLLLPVFHQFYCFFHGCETKSSCALLNLHPLSAASIVFLGAAPLRCAPLLCPILGLSALQRVLHTSFKPIFSQEKIHFVVLNHSATKRRWRRRACDTPLGNCAGAAGHRPLGIEATRNAHTATVIELRH